MSRLCFALACALAASGCATDPKRLPVHLDPSNPDAPEASPVAASTTLDPARSSGPAGGGDAPEATVLACPMHPEVRSHQPGECPRCGMDLVPVPAPPEGKEPQSHGPHAPTASASTPDAGSEGTESYSCPMHPEVRAHEPGRCPKCKMKLVRAGPERKTPEASVHGGHGGHGPPPSNVQQAEVPHSCPMHPEIRAEGPGRCPKCGMKLVPAQRAPASDGGTGTPLGPHSGHP